MTNFDDIHVGFIMEWVGDDFSTIKKGEHIEVYYKRNDVIRVAHRRGDQVISFQLTDGYITNHDCLVHRSMSISMFPPFGLSRDEQ